MRKHMSGESISTTQVPDGSLSDRAIKRRMRSEALQHQATLLPLTVFILCVIYLLLLSPVIGGGIWAIVSLVTSGLVAATGFIWRYTFHYREEYSIRMQELLENLNTEKSHLRQEEVAQLRETLNEGFNDFGSNEGVNILNRLTAEYEHLQNTKKDLDRVAPLSMSHIPGLADDAYHRGLSVLLDALTLMEAADSAEEAEVKIEIADMENAIEIQRKNRIGEEQLRIMEGRLAFRRERLEILERIGLRIHQLLFQAERCEVSLHHARIEIASIRTGISETSVESVLQTLHATIHQVKEVQEELKRLGY